jgi:hypothetical protein
MRIDLKLATLLVASALAAPAQDADRRVGSYRVMDGFEYGYRAAFVDGNREIYRSAVNYNNGLRLFDGILHINSGDGHGRFIDDLSLTTFGAGGDPYQATSLRVEKNLWFRFDTGFRIINYYNHLLALSDGEHRMNTERILQSYDLTLFPQRRIQLLLGYDRDNQNGPALTSQLIDTRREPAFPRDQFFVYADRIRRVNNQWRAGANATFAGFKLSFMQALDYYKEDPQNTIRGAQPEAPAGILPQTLRRDDPVHGRTPITRFNLHTDANRRFALNGRFIYSGGNDRFVLDENIGNLNPAAGIVTRQTFVLGTARRTQGTGDLTMTYQPGERWTISNTSAINQSRIDGDSAFVEMRTPVSPVDPARDEFFFDILSIRLLSNQTDVNFRATKKIGFYGGYHYSIRRIQSREILADISGFPTDVPLYSFQNVTNAGLAGVRLRPLAPLSLLFDAEYGRAGQPFTPVSEKRYHGETVKAQWKQKTWSASAGFKAYRNLNNAPPILDALEGASFEHRLMSRQYTANLSWTPPKRFTVDAGYGRLHLDTASGILNFPILTGPDVTARRSLYFSNLHHAHGTVRAEIASRVVLFLGYSVVKDTADGRKAATYASPFLATYPSFVFNGTDLINTYPLTYQSPQARLTIKLRNRIAWNAGWQYYGYYERFTGTQNYHANVVYTGLRSGF